MILILPFANSTVMITKPCAPPMYFYIENYSLFSPNWTYVSASFCKNEGPRPFRGLRAPMSRRRVWQATGSRWALKLSRKSPAIYMTHPRCNKFKCDPRPPRYSRFLIWKDGASCGGQASSEWSFSALQGYLVMGCKVHWNSCKGSWNLSPASEWGRIALSYTMRSKSSQQGKVQGQTTSIAETWEAGYLNL